MSHILSSWSVSQMCMELNLRHSFSSCKFRGVQLNCSRIMILWRSSPKSPCHCLSKIHPAQISRFIALIAPEAGLKECLLLPPSWDNLESFLGIIIRGYCNDLTAQSHWQKSADFCVAGQSAWWILFSCTHASDKQLRANVPVWCFEITSRVHCIGQLAVYLGRGLT